MARIAALTGAQWGRAQSIPGPAARAVWPGAANRSAALRIAWRTGERSGAGRRAAWPAALARAAEQRAGWGRGVARAQATRPTWGAPVYLAADARCAWGPALALAVAPIRAEWLQGLARATDARAAWGPARALAAAARVGWPGAVAASAEWRMPWSRHFHPLAAPVPVAWEHEPDPVPTHIVPLRLIYRMLHAITIRPVGDPVDLPCATLTVTQDADSWAYSVEVEVLGRSQWQRVAPVGGDPVAVVITVDGHEFHALIESCEGEHQHGRLPSGRARGRALSAWLAAEYSPPRDYVESADWTLAQIADRELPPAGWVLDWQAADGTVPAGAWSYQSLPPIAAIGRCAAAAGAIIVPSRTAQALTVLPRWPVLPWQLGGATPDIEIPIESLLSATESLPVPGAPADAVYVIGGDVGGILGRVLRAGTAGDRLASAVQDALITAEPIARARGEQVLADLWPEPAYSRFTTPLSAPGGDWPLLALGQLVSLTGPDDPVRGIVSSITLTARTSDRGAVVVEQQVGIGARSRNTYAAWRRLQDSRPLLPATVTAVIGGDRYTVELAIGGATIPVRSAASWTVGSTVWVQAGTIVGAAPAFGVAVELDV
mgnify:FL=1